MEERRQYVRVEDSLNVQYRHHKSILRSTSSVSDLSAGGLRLTTFQRFCAGTIVKLSFCLSIDADPVIVTGKVVWQDQKEDIRLPYILGIKFIDITWKGRERIGEYIQRKIENKRAAVRKAPYVL